MNGRSLLAGLMLVFPGLLMADLGDLPARTSGPYVGIGIGSSKIDTRDGATTVGGLSFSYRLLGGYRFAHLPLPFDIDIGLEVAYVDLGEVEEHTAGADVSVEMTALSTSGVIFLPVSDHWDVFGKMGVYFWDGTVTSDGEQVSEDSQSDLSFGLGVSWQTGSNFGAQFEIESLDALDGVWVGTLSATYHFK